MNLYELTDAQQRLQSMLEVAETEWEKQTAIDTYEAVDVAFDDKIMGYYYVEKNLRAQEEALKTEIDRLNNKYRVVKNNRERIKHSVSEAMLKVGKDKVEDEIGTVALQNNPPKLMILDESKLPKRYLIEQEPKLDKRALRADLLEGKEIEGAELIQEKGVRFR